MRRALTVFWLLACPLILTGGGCKKASPPVPPEPSGPPPKKIELPYDELTAQYSGEQVLAWATRTLEGQSCAVSPPLDAGAGYEANHHRITVSAEGEGTIEFSLAHSAKADLGGAIEDRQRHTPFRPIRPGVAARVVSAYKGERYAWLILRTGGQVRLTGVRHDCWRGEGTLYGHVAKTFEFEGGKLPYRLMYPRRYDSAKAYPLVLSVSGSGGVGTGNVRNMEMVILARYLFTQYHDDGELECFSLVPQIPSSEAIPAPYWPAGPRGGPTPTYHPDWPAVNENGWYVQATLALVGSLLEDESLHIDPDRVYYTGFSYGGKACWEFLKAGREVFAAAMCGAGWPIGRVYVRPTGSLLERLKLEVRRYKHIPVSIFAGQQDGMRYGSKAVHEEILAQGGNSRYVEFPNTTHVPSAGKTWGTRAYVQWLFRQNRSANPPAGEDPFGGGSYPD